MSRPVYNNIGVLGAGAWGTSLAFVAAQMADASTRRVKIWAYEQTTVDDINTEHQNRAFLPDITLPEAIQATTALADMVTCDMLLMAVPVQFSRTIIAEFVPLLVSDIPIVLCSKGVERDSLKLMHEVASAYLAPEQIAILSGPSFAADVARGRPTAVSLASNNIAHAEALALSLSRPKFRIYITDDVIGTEIGGTVKNVLAIACGLVVGKGFGESARVAMMTRGFNEMIRLGRALGGRVETMIGLSGLGDLALTASSLLSRNFSFGVALGEGQTAETILGTRKTVSEGVQSAVAVQALAARHKVDMPICEAVTQIIAGTISVDAAMADLFAGPVALEIDTEFS